MAELRAHLLPPSEYGVRPGRERLQGGSGWISRTKSPQKTHQGRVAQGRGRRCNGVSAKFRQISTSWSIPLPTGFTRSHSGSSTLYPIVNAMGPQYLSTRKSSEKRTITAVYRFRCATIPSTMGSETRSRLCDRRYRSSINGVLEDKITETRMGRCPKGESGCPGEMRCRRRSRVRTVVV